ncbi:MAG: response regulator transcription factor [Firmicutes bacterium]|nr:response regulator transcription factor [Bacillota bacterium]
MKELRAVICDDDRSWLAQAAGIIEDYAKEAGLQLQLRSYDEPAAVLTELTEAPDLFFMDIEFEEGPEGISLAKQMNERFPSCQIIYLTNYLHYALDVYQTEHIWYVLKPQLADRLPEVFQKLEQLEEDRRKDLVIHASDGTIVRLACGEILFMERQSRLTCIRTQSGSFRTRARIPELEKMLPGRTFARCHNSFIVNLPHIREIHAKSLLLDDGTEIIISRRYNNAFRTAYLTWAENAAI